MEGVVSISWEPACMEPDELERYHAGQAGGCADCTVAFSQQMAALGRCNGIPGELQRQDIVPLLEMLDGPDGRTPILNPDGSRRPYRAPRKERTMQPEPTKLTRAYRSPEAAALHELATAARDAADAAEEIAAAEDAAASSLTRLDEAAKAAGFRKRIKPPGRKPREPFDD